MRTSRSISAVLAALVIVPLSTPARAQVGTGAFIDRTLYHEGYTRHYFLYVPSDYDGSEEWPLVMSFHGFRWEAQDHALQDHMSLIADTAHFLVAYPQGLEVTIKFLGGIASGPGWDSDGSWAARNDVQFASLIIDDVDTDYAVDLSRVHAMGFSNGSVMSFGLACRLSDRIASIGGVAASMMDVDTNGGCQPTRTVATLQMHGTSDSGILYDYGWDYSDLPVIETSRFWARQNGCSANSVATDLPDVDHTDHSTVTLIEYSDCEDDTEVLFYRINGAGHTWPGSSSGAFRNDFKNQDIDASQEMWNFFARHPHPNPSHDYFYLKYQAQVDAFPSNLDLIPGYLWIGNSADINDLAPLSSLTSVEGDLVISAANGLTSLEGLSSVTSLGGELQIYSNETLGDLSGLSGLASVNGDLVIDDNAELTDIEGPSTLVTVGEDLTIGENPALTHIDGFSSLTSVGGSLSISGGYFGVGSYGNGALTRIGGFPLLTSVGEDLLILRNKALTDFRGLPSLASIGGNLEIKYNHLLSRLVNLPSLNTLEGSFTVVDNDALAEIDSLSSLTSVGGDVQINQNAALSSLNGFSALTSVGGDLEISWNDSLSNLDAFSSVNSIGGRLRIGVNPMLAACSCGLYACVSSGCVEGIIAMTANAASGDCNNNGADLVSKACGTGSAIEDEASQLPSRFVLHRAYPNPFNPTTTIQYDVPKASVVRLAVYDALGRVVESLVNSHQSLGKHAVAWDATGHPSGIYFYRLEAGDFVGTRSMILEK